MSALWEHQGRIDRLRERGLPDDFLHELFWTGDADLLGLIEAGTDAQLAQLDRQWRQAVATTRTVADSAKDLTA